MSSYREDAETRSVVLWLVKETPKARQFSTLHKGNKEGRLIWIPRSLIAHQSKDVPPINLAIPDEWPRCIVEVEEWFLDKNGL